MTSPPPFSSFARNLMVLHIKGSVTTSALAKYTPTLAKFISSEVERTEVEKPKGSPSLASSEVEKPNRVARSQQKPKSDNP